MKQSPFTGSKSKARPREKIDLLQFYEKSVKKQTEAALKEQRIINRKSNSPVKRVSQFGLTVNYEESTDSECEDSNLLSLDDLRKNLALENFNSKNNQNSKDTEKKAQ